MMMEHKFPDAFSDADDTLTVDIDGTTFRARIERDDTSDAPWDNSDLHGPVRRVNDTRDKEPGERILAHADRSSYGYLYDWQGAMQKARAEHWGCGIDGHEHKTPGERAACACEQDFKFIQSWLNDEWWYVGVVIEAERNGWKNDHLASLWGIDSNSTDYLTQTANELLNEAVPQVLDEPIANTL